MKKPVFRICENKGIDQLGGNPLFPLHRKQVFFFLNTASNFLMVYSLVCVGTGLKPQDRFFSHDRVHI